MATRQYFQRWFSRKITIAVAIFLVSVFPTISVLCQESAVVLAISSNDAYRLKANTDGTIAVYENSTGNYLGTFTLHDTYVWEVEPSPISNVIASSDDEGNIYIWNPESQSLILAIDTGLMRPVRSISWSSDGSKLAAVIADSADIVIYDSSSGEVIRLIHTLSTPLALDFNLVDSTIAVGTLTAIELLDSETGDLLEVVEAEQGALAAYTDLKWEENGRLLAFGTMGKAVAIWDRIEKTITSLGVVESNIQSLSWSPTGSFISVTGGGRLAVWRVESATLYESLEVSHLLRSSAWSSDSQVMFISVDGNFSESTEVLSTPTPTSIPTATPTATLTLTNTPTFTPTLTPTFTPTPTSTPFGGGGAIVFECGDICIGQANPIAPAAGVAIVLPRWRSPDWGVIVAPPPGCPDGTCLIVPTEAPEE